MKTKENVIKTRSNGLNHFDKAVVKSGRNFILTKTIEFSKEYPDTWGGGWDNVVWAAGNVVIEVLDKEIQQSWNLDEAFTEEEMKYLAKQLYLDIADFKPIWKRKETK